jgi:2-oxoglutarate dehydrogenase E1 component
MQWATPREIVSVLQRNYCGKVGLEYMHIADVAERKFLQDRIEGGDKSIDFTPNGKKAILAAVIRGEQYEKFLGKKYVGTKRFGLDGGESMIPALEAVIKYGGQLGVREIIYGMAHRGRLNVLANVLAKPYRVIFHEFAGGSANPDDIGGSGDVKYHLGTSTDVEVAGQNVHISLQPNPSHLEVVNPVIEGMVRALQRVPGRLAERDELAVVPVAIHGDAAFPGEGIVAETLNISHLNAYRTGGTIHIIVNNQVGFTTDPTDARSTHYASDLAKGFEMPVFSEMQVVEVRLKEVRGHKGLFGREIGWAVHKLGFGCRPEVLQFGGLGRTTPLIGGVDVGTPVVS